MLKYEAYTPNPKSVVASFEMIHASYTWALWTLRVCSLLPAGVPVPAFQVQFEGPEKNQTRALTGLKSWT